MFLAAAILLATGGVMAAFAGGKAETGGGGGTLPPVTLTMIIPGPPQKDQQRVDDAISKYLQPTLNIKLNIQQYDYSGWNDRSNLVIASGENCDILFSAAWSDFGPQAVKGAFVELTDLLNKYGQDILKQPYAWILDAGKVGGKLYGLATYEEIAQQRGFFLRKDLVDKYRFQVKPLNDVTDLEPMLKTIQQNEPGMQPLFMERGHLLSEMGPWDRQSNNETTAIDVTNPKAEYVNFFDNDYYRTSMNIARKWFVNGYVNKDIATTQENAYNIIRGGNTFAVNAITNAGLQDARFSSMWGVPIVSFNTIKSIISTSLIQGALFVIPIQSKNRERAMMFLNRMHTDPVLVNLLVYGEEGIDYVKKGPTQIDLPPGVKAGTTYSGIYWMMGNEALEYTYGNQDPRFPQLLNDWIQSAIRTPALGFTYNPEKMKNQMAALSNIATQYDPPLSSGSVDPNSGMYQELLGKLKSAGIDDLLADQNGQLNDWLKTNKK